MRAGWCVLLLLLAGCSANDAPPSQSGDLSPLPPAPTPREIANTTILFAMPLEANGEVPFSVAANASRVWIRFLMHEAALGFSLLQGDPEAGNARVEFNDPAGGAWSFNVPGVFDFNPGPTAPWYAADGNQTAPEPGEWSARLVGWGRNVAVDVIVREFAN